MMDLVNIASPKYQCKVLKASSSENEVQHPPSSILAEENDNVWVSGEGLPQQLIITLESVQFAYKHIAAVAFVCAHDYETNPKIIEIWVAENQKAIETSQFIFWNQLKLKKKRGKQIFSISEIPQSHRIIMLKITQTYGQYQTYLNQVMLLAEPDSHTSQSLYNQEEWNKLAQSRAKNRKQSKTQNSEFKNWFSSNNKRLQTKEESPLDILMNGHEDEDLFRKKENMNIGQIEDNSFERNAALLTMSKNMIIMEDNIEELTRKVEILEKKVEYTYQNLESNFMKKIEEMVDRKIQRQLSQKQLIEDQPKRMKSCKDLTTSRTIQHGQEKQKKVMSLVAELNDKLKQRTKLANKLQKRLKVAPKSQYYD